MKTYEIKLKAVITKTLHVSGPEDSTTALNIVLNSIKNDMPMSTYQKYEAGKGNFAPPVPAETLNEVLETSIKEIEGND